MYYIVVVVVAVIVVLVFLKTQNTSSVYSRNVAYPSKLANELLFFVFLLKINKHDVPTRQPASQMTMTHSC